MNKSSKIDKLIKSINSTQNLLILKKLNPIFEYPEPIVTNRDAIGLKYPDSVLEHRLRNAILDLDVITKHLLFDDIRKLRGKDTHFWIVVENMVVCYFYKIEENINKPYARYFLFKEAPFYIQALARPAIKRFKRSVVIISDDLPFSISMIVNLHTENQREDVLSSKVDFLNAQELIEVNDIIRDKSISLRDALDNILKLTGVKTESNVSYCLTCGREIDSGKKFCDSTKYSYKNRNHCLIQFNYWLKARLGIKTTLDRRKKRNGFYKELVELSKDFPLTAWNEFKLKYPKLYEKRYKERWERERRLKP